jgi:putative ABC transport system permease protein
MKFFDTARRGGRNLRSAKLRTLLTALAISIGGLTLTLTLAASQGARDYTARLVSSNFDPKAVFVAKDKSFFSNTNGDKPREYTTDLGRTGRGELLKEFDSSDIAAIKKLPHIVGVIENYSLNAQFITREGAKKYTGSLTVYDSSQKPVIAAGSAPDVLADDTVLMPDDYISLLNFQSPQDAIGKTLSVQIQQVTGKTQVRHYKVAGVTTKSNLSLNFSPLGLYVSEHEAGNLNSFINGGTVGADKVASLLVRGDGVSADTLKAEMQQKGFEARTAKDLQQFITQIVNILGIIITVFGIVTLVASFFGVVNTQYISVLERTREVGLMKALGMRRKTVLLLFIIEATWIGFIGAALGSGAGVVLGTLLNPWISKKINFGSQHLLVFIPWQIAALVLFLMLVTTVAGLLPARKAAKLDPIEALRTE